MTRLDPEFSRASELRRRCDELDVLFWWRGADDTRTDGPAEGDRTPLGPVSREIASAVAAAMCGPPSPTREALPGWWLIVHDETRAHRTIGRMVVLAPSSNRSATEADRLARVLRWSLDDLSRTEQDRGAIANFGGQLSEVYEEIGALYRIGRAMGNRTRPEDFVLSTCREVQQTLPFRWTAAVFRDGDASVPLAGRVLATGDIPCPRQEFDTLAAATLPNLVPGRWSLVEPTAPSGLGRLVGAQVLVHPICEEGRVTGALLAGNKSGEDAEITSFETQLIDAAADFLGVFVENTRLNAEQRALFIGSIEALSSAIDAKDRYTYGHSDRVALMASRLAAAIGMPAGQVERIRLAGLLHDVGKIGVPEAVLTKCGRLTDEEFDQIKRHPEIGFRILRDLPTLEDILPGVLHHHERYDGRGYPHRLAGEDIPLIARILAVADSFDAMSSTRSYRSALPRQKVLAEIAANAGSQFDARLAHAFVSLEFSDYDRLVDLHRAAEPRVAA